MVGKSWISTPFVLNYGFDVSGFSDNYIEYDIDLQCDVNYYGMTKPEVIRRMKAMAHPDYYGVSFRCGDVGYAKYGAPSKVYNTIQLLFDDSCLKICGLWYDRNYEPKLSDYVLIGLVHFNKKQFRSKLKRPVLITCDNLMFKYTMNLYEDLMYLRFDKSFGKSSQYSGVIRFDSGMDDESGRIEQFSLLFSTMTLSDETVISCINRISALH